MHAHGLSVESHQGCKVPGRWTLTVQPFSFYLSKASRGQDHHHESRQVSRIKPWTPGSHPILSSSPRLLPQKLVECDRQNNGPKACLCPSPRTHECVNLCGKKTVVCVIKLKLSRWDLILCYLHSPTVITVCL